MRVIQINSVCGTGSTGKIAVDIYNTLVMNGNECLIAYGRGSSPKGINSYKISSSFGTILHAFYTRITDKHGLFSKKATKKLIKVINNFQPDIIHLHNIHGYYLNIKSLFEYLHEIDIPVIWTLHDCWAFTGHCAYFDFVGCNKWKNFCFNCPQKREYPKSYLLDSSKYNYMMKNKLFNSIKNMILVTPSNWLSNLVKQSFISKYNVTVINNGIDLNIFKPTKSDFRKKNNLCNKFIILGVANIWDRRKGFDSFIKLSKLLNEKFVIVMIGLNKNQIDILPSNIIGFGRTNSVHELSEIYSSSDVFVNPTLEDNFPTTNIESLACGTPVITYNTGGSIESLDNSTGFIVEQGNIIELYDKIKLVYKNGKEMYYSACINRAGKLYDKSARFLEYSRLYTSMCKNSD